MTARRLWAPVLGLVCALILVLAAVTHLPASARQLSDRRAAAQEVTAIRGIPETGGLPPATPEFLHHVRELVPDHGRIRVLVGRQRACHGRPGQLYWFAYHLLPRVIVCDASARYWVLVRTGPVTVPAGSRVVLEPTADLRFVDTRPGES